MEYSLAQAEKWSWQNHLFQSKENASDDESKLVYYIDICDYVIFGESLLVNAEMTRVCLTVLETWKTLVNAGRFAHHPGAASHDAAPFAGEPDQHRAMWPSLDEVRTRLLHDIKEFFLHNPDWRVEESNL